MLSKDTLMWTVSMMVAALSIFATGALRGDDKSVEGVAVGLAAAVGAYWVGAWISAFFQPPTDKPRGEATGRRPPP